MNGYICFWGGNRCEVHADTSYAAQQKAVSVFQMFQKGAGRKKKVKGHDVTVLLAEKAGEQVTHATDAL